MSFIIKDGLKWSSIDHGLSFIKTFLPTTFNSRDRHRSELYAFIDATPLNLHSALRTSLSHLNAAGTILRALFRSQLPGKPSKLLFHLTLAYLHHLPEATSPDSFTASYLLKLIKHEGYPTPPNTQELLEVESFKKLKTLTALSEQPQEIYDYLMNKIKE